MHIKFVDKLFVRMVRGISSLFNIHRQPVGSGLGRALYCDIFDGSVNEFFTKPADPFTVKAVF